MENITEKELTETIFSIHKLHASGEIDEKTFNNILKCFSVVVELQNFGKEDRKMEPIKYNKGEEPDCNLCGDYEYCAFNYNECTGFIPYGENSVGCIENKKVALSDISRPCPIKEYKESPLDKFV